PIYPSDFPPGRLVAIPADQPALRRRRFARDGGCGLPDSPGAGLSPGARSTHGERRPARRPGGDFLAHSLAQRGSVRDLPLATRTDRRTAGADLIGFHIQTHCNNFLETVDRALEALTEWDRFAVSRQGHVTRVRPYPISVAFPESPTPDTDPADINALRQELSNEMDIEAAHLGVGVDRVDYTKGIPERFRALERFFELNP